MSISLFDKILIENAIIIVNKAKENNLILRILGALGVYINISDNETYVQKLKLLGRLENEEKLFTDIDLIGYSKQRKNIRKFFEEILKFKSDFYINRLFGDKRLIFYDENNKLKIDVFLDKLEFSHDIILKDRLELNFPTITIEDLILEKLQIHKINKKDLVDLSLLFLKYKVIDRQETNYINGKYIAKILSEDWGFWYDAINNLNKVKNFVKKYTEDGKFSEEERKKIFQEIDTLIYIIEKTPKTKKWLERSKVGTSKQWYREVEEIER